MKDQHDKELMKTPVRIIDFDSNELISTTMLMKGQTYTIPKGYDIVTRTISDSLETVYISNKNCEFCNHLEAHHNEYQACKDGQCGWNQ